MTALALPLAILARELENCADHLRDVAQGLPTGHRPMQGLGHLAEEPWAWAIVSACLLPALGEELFCRGFVGRGLVGRWGAVAGVGWTSLLFAAMHLEVAAAIGALGLGIGLHCVYLQTRSLAAPIVLHAACNLAALVMLRQPPHLSLPGLADRGEPGHVSPPLLLAALVTAIALSLLLRQMRTRWRQPDGQEWSPGYLSGERPPAELGAAPVVARPHPALVFVSLAALASLVAALLAALPAAQELGQS